MKYFTIAMIAFSFYACSFSSSKQNRKVIPPDEIYKEKIIGTWICDQIDGGYAETTFKTDGTLTVKATMTINKQIVDIFSEGIWEIKNGYIIENYLRCTIPKVIDNIPQSRDEIIRFEDNTLTVITINGKKHIHRKK